MVRKRHANNNGRKGHAFKSGLTKAIKIQRRIPLKDQKMILQLPLNKSRARQMQKGSKDHF